MAPVLLGDEEWVENLVEEQKDAINYKEDEDEGLFITHMDLINEVPIRTDTLQQSQLSDASLQSDEQSDEP